MMPPWACFQLEHCVRLSDLQLTGPGAHWTVCVHAAGSVIVRSRMCVTMCEDGRTNARMWDSVCALERHTLRVCVCVFGMSPRVAIHLDSLCSPITSLSRHFLTRTSDGGSPEGERDGRRRWMAERTTDLIGLIAEKRCDTLI